MIEAPPGLHLYLYLPALAHDLPTRLGFLLLRKRAKVIATSGWNIVTISLEEWLAPSQLSGQYYLLRHSFSDHQYLK